MCSQPMVQAAQDLSEQFPETTFGVIYDPLPEDSDALPSNMLTWDFIAQEGSFLAGALAAHLEPLEAASQPPSLK